MGTIYTQREPGALIRLIGQAPITLGAERLLKAKAISGDIDLPAVVTEFQTVICAPQHQVNDCIGVSYIST